MSESTSASNANNVPGSAGQPASTSNISVGNVNSGAGSAKVRLCKLRISNEGDYFKYPINATVSQNRWNQCNTFVCKIALYGDDAHDLAWWGSMARVDRFFMEIEFGVGDPDDGDAGVKWQKMITGPVDKISVDIRKGVVTCHGRDLLALLVETVMNRELTNRKYNDFVSEMFEQHGLKTEFNHTNNPDLAQINRGDKLTTAGVGNSMLSNEFTGLSWFNMLANSFGYMDGDTYRTYDQNDYLGTWSVRLEPPTANDQQVVILPASNATEIIFERDLNVARNTSVKLTSHNAQTGEALSAVDTQSKLRAGVRTHTVERTVPGVSDNADLQTRADSLRDAIIRHEKKLHWSEPGDLYLTVLYKAILTGGHTDWHQEYWIESLERSMDWKGGFRMDCIGSNVDPSLGSDEAY